MLPYDILPYGMLPYDILPRDMLPRDMSWGEELITLGYPIADETGAIGFRGQIGLLYRSDAGFIAGLSYKSPRYTVNSSLKILI